MKKIILLIAIAMIGMVGAWYDGSYNFIENNENNFENINCLDFNDYLAVDECIYDSFLDKFHCLKSTTLYYNLYPALDGFSYSTCSLSNSGYNLIATDDNIFYLYLNGNDLKVRKMVSKSCTTVSYNIDDNIEVCVGSENYIYCLRETASSIVVEKYDNYFSLIDDYTISVTQSDTQTNLQYLNSKLYIIYKPSSDYAKVRVLNDDLDYLGEVTFTQHSNEVIKYVQYDTYNSFFAIGTYYIYYVYLYTVEDYVTSENDLLLDDDELYKYDSSTLMRYEIDDEGFDFIYSDSISAEETNSYIHNSVTFEDTVFFRNLLINKTDFTQYDSTSESYDSCKYYDTESCDTGYCYNFLCYQKDYEVASITFYTCETTTTSTTTTSTTTTSTTSTSTTINETTTTVENVSYMQIVTTTLSEYYRSVYENETKKEIDFILNLTEKQNESIFDLVDDIESHKFEKRGLGYSQQKEEVKNLISYFIDFLIFFVVIIFILNVSTVIKQ